MKRSMAAAVVLVGCLVLTLTPSPEETTSSASVAVATTASDDACNAHGVVLDRGASACDPSDSHAILACPATGGAMTVEHDAERQCTLATNTTTHQRLPVWVSDPAFTVQILEPNLDAVAKRP